VALVVRRAKLYVPFPVTADVTSTDVHRAAGNAP